MKKTIRVVVSLLLVCSMVISSGMSAFASEPTTVNELNTALDELLEIAKESGSENYTEEEKEAFEVYSLEENLDVATYCRPDVEYIADENSHYVSLGDSTVTGMHLEGYGNYGYMTKVPDSFPYQIAKRLNLNVDTQYIQLACGGLRAEDIRFILDESYTGDAYTEVKTIEALDKYAGGIEATRKAYKENLAKADFVTVGMAGNSFGTFTNVQVARLEEGLEPLEMDWSRYLGTDGASVVESILSGLKSLLLEAGVGEADTNIAALYVESLLYGYIGFASNYEATLDAIREHSPEANLAIVGLYDIAKGVYLDIEGIRLELGDFLGKLIDFINAHYKIYAALTDNTVFVDVSDTETFIDIATANGEIDLSLFNYLRDTAEDTEIDDHPSIAGHTYIADKVLSRICYSPVPEVDEPEEEEPSVPEVDEPEVEEPSAPEVDEPEKEEPSVPGVDEPEEEEPSAPETNKPAQSWICKWFGKFLPSVPSKPSWSGLSGIGQIFKKMFCWWK